MSDSLRADPPLGGTLAYIDSVIPALVPSEQRVARAILESPEDVAMMSAADLAARTGTSNATVIRASQSLGFKGFQHLRLLLLRDMPSRPSRRSSTTRAPRANGCRRCSARRGRSWPTPSLRSTSTSSTGRSPRWRVPGGC
ncbi:MurR/RpiR family transcriptional regulator [Leifsonia sp. NPDC014704]|uniref:MurR/RpiR family transcriptional regulator n=1 Tax=Leifsonia sp. NPDC014704 TaxID=3364123 RepID=UPI0036F49D57